MKHFIRRGIAICLLLAMLIGLVPSLYAAEDTAVPIENDDLKHAGEKILGYWINPSNFTISNANIDNLTNLGVTDIYVLVKGEAGSINTTALKNVISYASSKVRVHAWVMCARDNAYLKSHPTHAVYHFRVGYKNNAHSSSSSYYDSRNGFVDLRNTSYQKYFNGIVDDLEAIDGLDGIHLDTIRYGGDYYDWSTNLKNALGKSNYNTMAKTMCDHHGYTYAADSNGYYVFTGTKTADDSSMRTLINANGAVAKAYREYRMATVTNFVKSVRENLSSDMILTAACMPEPALSLYGKATYGQDFASMAPYVDYVQIMSYFGDYYFINNNTYDTSWPANICKRIAKEGCNVVAGIQGYAFVNEDSEGRNGMNPTGYESQKQAEAINDARREINGDPAYGGDILGSAVFRGGTSSQASVIYDPSAQTVTFKLVAGATAIKSIRIRLYNGFYINKSKCTVSDKSYTYNGVTYTVTGTATNDYYHTFDLSTTINAYGTKTLTIPVCKSDGTKKEVDYNYNHFAAVNIYSSTSKSNSTYLPIYLDGYVNSAHKTCSFTKTTPQPATCLTPGYHLYTCATCGYDYSEYIPQLSHAYVAAVTAPTCTQDGFTTYTCKNGCNDSYIQDPVAALGHSYEMTTTEPTCTENGAKIYTCVRCADSYEEPIEALGHQYEAVVTEPDCENEGFTTYTCACGESYTDRFVPALGHNYTEERILEPTCTEDGIMRFTCACGKSYEEPIEALGHQYEAVVTEPDCENEGFTTYTCVCGESYTGDYVAALGHSYRYTEQENEHLVNCTNCDLEFTEAHEPDGMCCAKCGAVICLHTNERSVVNVDATCTQAGSASIFCADCDEYLRTEEMPAKGHDLTHYGYKLPTCTEPGSHEHWKCNVCEKHFTDASCEYELPPSYANKPALGHSHTYEDLGNGTHAIGCVRCEYYETDEHSFAEGKCICGAKEEPKFDAALAFRMNISVGAEMVVNYTFMTSAVSKYADFYLEVSKNVAGGEPQTTVYGLGEREALTATNHPVTGEALLYQAAYQGINAKEMGDSFCATLYAVAEDGTVFCGETVTASIRDFLLGKIEDSSSEVELKTMAVDMLKYGAAAQIRLGYDTEHLVTDGLTEEQLGYATQTLPEAMDNAATDGEGANVNTNITIGARVELSASTICWDVADPTTVRCVIADSKGRVLAEPKVSTAADVMFSALYSNVGARQMREIITVTFYSGDTAISKTLSWSVESYVAQVRAKANVTLAELNMVNALLAYGDSVAAYMTASGQ